MEPLIFGLIIAAVGAFFNNKKKDDAQDAEPGGKSKPAGSTRERTFKRAEDYAKEIYGEFQSQMNGPRAEQQQRVEKKAEQLMERKPVQQAKKRVQDSTSGGRLSAHQSASRAPRNKPVQEDLFPLTPDDAQKAIILAEIFMPPKSKR